MRRPCALTQGDPAGIGLEIALRAWLDRDRIALPPFFLLTDPACLRARAARLGWDVPIAAVAPQDAVTAFGRALPVVPLRAAVAAAPGRPDPAGAAATIEAIETRVPLGRGGPPAAPGAHP